MMKKLFGRFPARNEISMVFGVVVFAVYAWSIKMYFYEFPAFILMYGVWELFSIFAYMMTFALVESVLVTSLLVLLGFLLPAGWYREGFSYKGSLTIALAAGFSIYLQKTLTMDFPSYRYLLTVVVTYLLVLTSMIYAASRFEHLRKLILFLADRISIILYLYLPINFISLLVVIFRIL
ncbi:MAG: hypothetical protein JXA13_08325 [Anaerolineales bacterium]|nr:hypothetical protein [Anaerolineales bacterium]